MKSIYPLKQSKSFNITLPLLQYLRANESPSCITPMGQALIQINQLRNKVTSLELPPNLDPDNPVILQKYITSLELYSKFIKLIMKHFNWDATCGPVVEGFNLTWNDSFNPEHQWTSSSIHYDLFCCFYNLGSLYFHLATKKCMSDFINQLKDGLRFAKRSAYYFNYIRFMHNDFAASRFCDTSCAHLEMLELLSLGIVYKCMFNLFKQDEYKHGIQRIGALALLAQGNFYRGYQIGLHFLLANPHIPESIQKDLLSFAYVESLVHDVIGCLKYAKFYDNQMDTKKDSIMLVIGFQKKALRLLELGLQDDKVGILLDERPEQRKWLINTRPVLKQSLAHNINRNKQIYKKIQIPQEQITKPEPPKQYLIKMIEPQQIAIEYDGKNTSPFYLLLDNETRAFSLELKQISKRKIEGLLSANHQIHETIDQIYNNYYVNYYLNLKDQKEEIPQVLRTTFEQIKKNGGKNKIDEDIEILKKTSEKIQKTFQLLRKLAKEEQENDQIKRNYYENQWKRQPSRVVNRPYFKLIQSYEKKAALAEQVNEKLFKKRQEFEKHISIAEGSQAQIIRSLPKLHASRFLLENQTLYSKLESSKSSIQEQLKQLEIFREDLKKKIEKIDCVQMSQKHKKQVEEENKEIILDQIFQNVFKMIKIFNGKAQKIEETAKNIGEYSKQLNEKNKGQNEDHKKKYQAIIKKFTEVNSLFTELQQGKAFYQKIEEILVRIHEQLAKFVTARNAQAQELQKTFFTGNKFRGPQFPNMYPYKPPSDNQTFYVPPPLNENPNFSPHHKLSKSLFSNSSNIYESRYK